MPQYLSDDDVFGPSESRKYLAPEDVLGDGRSASAGKATKGAIGDLGTSLLSGVEQMPGQAAGLVDLQFALAFGARPVSTAFDAIGRLTGFQPGKWAKQADQTEHSPQHYESQRDVQRAWARSDAVLADPNTSKTDYLRSLASDLPGVAAAYIKNPMYSLNQVAESLPSSLAGGLISRPLMVAGRLLPVAENTAAGIAARAGTAGYFERAVGEKLAAPIAGGVGEGAVQAGQALDQSTGADQRKNAVAALASGFVDALIAAGAGRAANKMGWETHNTAMAKFGDMAPVERLAVLKRVAGGAASESVLQELPQSMQEQVFQNWADGKPLMEGVARAGIEGAISGGLMGAGFNALPGGQKVQEQGGGAPVAESHVPAPEAGDGGAAPTRAAAAPDSVSAAEQALRAPAPLTALDRVSELDSERAAAAERLAELSRPEAGYGPLFEDDRKAAADKVAALDAERAVLAKDWPATLPGARTSFTTEAGARIEAQYALADVNTLVTSHDEGLRANPAYPQELQPRERDRAASEAQVAAITQKLDPARLGLSADAATGAPIIGADGLVESGNARTIALKRIYRVPGQKAAEYKAFLRDNAAQFGLTPEAVDAIDKPVLVRVRTTPVNRAEFARQANASMVAAMAPGEQARSDAQRIDSMDDLSPDDSGDFSNAASRGFVARFMARLPATEQAGLVDGAGRLSSAGYTRVRNAVLAKAYGDSPVLLRMVESMDDNLRNLSKALITAAPRVAQMRQAVAQGDRFDADITPDLLAAVEELSALKDSGTSLNDALAQADMLGDKYSAETRALLAFLAENIRRPRRMADFISAYIEALDVAGDPKQGSLLGEVAAPAKSELMGQARRSIDATAEDAAANTERRDAGQNPPPAGQTGSEPTAAPGGGRGDQGHGAAAANDGIGDQRAAAVQDFKDALADLAQIASKHTRAAMMPEDMPGLMESLVKLFEAAIQIVGTDLKAAIAHVKAAMKADPKLKTSRNKIGDEMYQKAALRALQNIESGGNTDLATAPSADRLIVNPIDINGSPEEKVKQLEALTAQNRPIVKDLLKRIDDAFGTKSGDNVKEPSKILSKAKRPSILKKKPWHDVEHIRDSYRFKTVLNSISQLPGVLKVIEGAGIEVVKRDVNKLLTPLEWGWRIVVFDLRMPNGQLVEFYLPITEMEKAKKTGGYLLFEQWRNEDPNALNEEQTRAMRSSMRQSTDLYQAAWDAYLARSGDTETAIRAALMAASVSAGDASLYPSSSKAPSVTEGAGDSQAPAASRAAEKSPSYTKAAVEPSQSNQTSLFDPLISAAPFKQILPQKPDIGYSGPAQDGASNANDQHRQGSAQGEVPRAVQGPAGQGRAQSFRGGPGGPDLFGDGGPDAGAAPAGELGQPGPGGVRGQDEDGGGAEQGSSDGRPAGVPAGLGFQVMAGTAAKAIDSAVASNGGTAADWSARLATEAAPAAQSDTLWGVMAADTGAGTTADVVLSRGAGGGMEMGALRALAARVKAKMPNMPEVVVLADPSGAPAKLREFIRKQGAWGDVEGAMHAGKVYLFASGLSDEVRAEHVLAEHEAAHVGLRAVLGASLKRTMLGVYANNASVRRAVADLMSQSKMSVAVATEEVLVDMPTSALVRLNGWRRVTTAVRDALAAVGFTRLAAKLTTWLESSLSDQERADLFVADLVRGARGYVAGKRARVARIDGATRLSETLAEDAAWQEAWLTTEATARGYKDIEDLLARNYPLFEKLAALWRKQHPGESLLSRGSVAPAQKTDAQRAEAIIQTKAGSRAPLDALARGLTRITGVERMMGAAYRKAAFILDRYTPEVIKAGVMSDYGVPEAVIDQRAMMQGRQRVQLRQAGSLIDKLSNLTRAESRVAYEWMNMDGADPRAYVSMMHGLPEESVKVLQEVQQMIDRLSREAVRMGQLSAEAYERNRFAYLRRSYAKYVTEQTAGDKAKRARLISILGDQYKGRGLSEAASMKQIQNLAPEWWKRKLQAGKADASLKGERFVRMERHAPSGEGTTPMAGIGDRTRGRLLEVAYFPAGEPLPAKYTDWTAGATFEVRDIKGDQVVLWRDFTKDERENMGEIDEARFAIAKTLHGMIHDVEVGRYLEWLAQTQALKEGQAIPGEVVDASERYRDVFKPGEWVRVPDAKIQGTSVAKYGKLAGRYVPGPVWNDLRQTMNGQFRPFGDTYAKVLTLWKTAKTALSPAVHTNNVMANFVMADWHDVGAMHIAKALRIMLAANKRDGKGAIGRLGNVVSRGGISDRGAALEILNRYKDSGGDIGSWATNEIAQEQLAPLLESLEAELAATGGNSVQAQVGVMSALQHALMRRFPSAWDAFKGSKPGQVVGTEAKALIGLYQSEDDVFRLAAWLKAKEDGQTDLQAGKLARRSFLDYHINAPWIQAMRNSGWPFISFTYRAVPQLLETFGAKPHKIMKLMLLAGAIDALGVALGGGGDDRERKLLPEEKAGRVWGMVPKLVRMPWNDAHGSPVYLDIRRFIPVGDVFDVGQEHSAVPLLPGLVPGGPLVIMAELLLNRAAFTGKAVTLDTDTATQRAAKVVDHLYKGFAPNILGLPGTYATQGVADAVHGRTDKFGREMSVGAAMASSFGVKLGSYPADVLRRNLQGKLAAEMMELDRNIAALRRQYQTHAISGDEYQQAVQVEQQKKRDAQRKLSEKMN